jgi:hypothetical protein
VRVFILIILLFSIETATACQCPGNVLSEKVAKSDYIYLGINVKATLQEKGSVLNTMKPIEVFKGEPDQWLLKSKGGPIKMCSAIAAVGLRYIVYGRIGEIPELTLCGYSQHFDSESKFKLREIRDAVNAENKE